MFINTIFWANSIKDFKLKNTTKNSRKNPFGYIKYEGLDAPIISSDAFSTKRNHKNRES